MIVTAVNNVKTATPELKEIELSQVFVHISSNEKLKEDTINYREFRRTMIEKINSTEDESKKKEYKDEIDKAKSNFKAIVVACGFKTNDNRNKYNAGHITGMISVDIDHIDNIENVFNIIKNDKYTCMVYRSPSGEGLKLIVKYKKDYLTDLQDQIKFFEQQLFDHIKGYYKTNNNLDVDIQTKDVTRLAYICYDEQSYYNEGSIPFDFKPRKNDLKKSFTATGNNILDKLYNVINDNKLTLEDFLNNSIGEKGRYNNWYNFGFCLCNQYGTREDSIKTYWHMFSALDADYKEADAHAKIENLIKTFDSTKKNYKYFFNMMVKYAELNYGLELTADEKKEVKQDKDCLAEYIKENIIIRYEVVTQIKYITYKYKDRIYDVNYEEKKIEDEDLNTITNIFERLFGSIGILKIRQLLFDCNMIKYNKVQEYLDSVRCEDDTNLKILLDYFGTEESDDIKYMYIKSWMMGVFSNFYKGDDKFKHFLIIKGGQSIGKTTFVNNILLKPFVEMELVTQDFHFSTASKDDSELLYSMLFIFDDDLSASTKQDMGAIKKITSQPYTDLRKSYGYEKSRYYRICSFIGCSNEDLIYKDDTGGTRFFILTMNKMIPMRIYKEQFTLEFMGKVWGYMYNEYLNGERWNTPKYMFDYKLHNEIAERSRIETTQLTHLKNIIVPDENNYMTLGEIISRCQREYPDVRLVTGDNGGRLGKDLKLIGVGSKRTKKGMVYKCRVDTDISLFDGTTITKQEKLFDLNQVLAQENDIETNVRLSMKSWRI